MEKKVKLFGIWNPDALPLFHAEDVILNYFNDSWNNYNFQLIPVDDGDDEDDFRYYVEVTFKNGRAVKAKIL